MVYELLKTILKLPFRLAGYDITPQADAGTELPGLPPVMAHPVEALYRAPISHEGSSAFHCNLNWCVSEYGLGFGNKQWHPFVTALRDYKENNSIVYHDSVLKHFYSSWQPQNAKEVLLGEEPGPGKLFKTIPIGYVAPWRSKSIEERIEEVREYMRSENKDAGYSDIDSNEGFNHFGPVTERKGRIEFQRLCSVYHSIKKKGYQRSCGWDGDIRGYLLRRDGEYRYVVIGGHHRLAAIAALGYRSVPVRIDFPLIIEPHDADYWPQVKEGIWTKKEALRYFNRLFDFDSRKWAVTLGLAHENKQTSG